MSLSSLFFLLQQEGFILRSCICSGLTEIRNANIGEKGRYYTAFFQLAIGLERMSKLAFILKHMVSHNLSAPGEEIVRSYGHDITTLFHFSEKIACERGYFFADKFRLSSLCEKILDFLTRFAKGTRYANLDALATGIITTEPLSEWNKILNEVIKADVSETKRKRIINESILIEQKIKDRSLIHFHDLENKLLSHKDWLSLPRLQDEAARYAVWYLILIYTPLKELVCKLGCEAKEINHRLSVSKAHIPEMSEFFSFLWQDRAYVLRKKKWP